MIRIQYAVSLIFFSFSRIYTQQKKKTLHKSLFRRFLMISQQFYYLLLFLYVVDFRYTYFLYIIFSYFGVLDIIIFLGIVLARGFSSKNKK